MFENKKILVAGSMGRSGKAAAELFLGLGGTVILSDQKEGALPESIAAFGDRVVDARPRDDEKLIEDYRPDLLVTAPGVPLANPLFRRAYEAKIPVYGESDFAWKILCEHRSEKPILVGVTGTDGKSTTTALITFLLESAGVKAVSCGNFGLPVSDLAGKNSEQYDAYVAELSSYQLEPLQFMKPDVSMILNIAEDHLDRYSGMDEYTEAKLHILNLQDEEDLFLAPDSIRKTAEQYLKKIGRSGPERKTPPSMEKNISFMDFQDIPVSEFSLKGSHNYSNLSFALSALEHIAKKKSLKIREDRFRKALGSFQGLSHRFESLGTVQGISFVNDSKSTTCQSLVTALDSLKGSNVFLLCGGRNKGIDFSVLKKYASSVNFYPYGEAGPEIASIVQTQSFSDMKTAFDAAVHSARKSADAIVLLSPGCSSFDLYASYAERGTHFKTLVGLL